MQTAATQEAAQPRISRSRLDMSHLIVRSKLRIRPEAFWGEQSIATVNFELGPWIRMSAPAAWRSLTLKAWRGTGPFFKSWVLFLGVLPLDRHAFGSLDLSQELKFVERSSSWLNRVWRHERTARAVPGGCEVIDQISFTSRLPLLLLSPVLRAIYVRVFRHRHARLRARYGAASD